MAWPSLVNFITPSPTPLNAQALYIPFSNDYAQDYLFSRLQLVAETNKPTNQNSIKVPKAKVVMPINKKTLL